MSCAAEQKNDKPEKSKEHSPDQSKKRPYSTPVFKELTEQPDAFSWVQRKKEWGWQMSHA